ncbi:dioxygenase [Microbacterium sp. SMR1]|uniref:dioxygenase n=1 Tax=Microbacterium sp. SMR1 TaxID=1497340 RepID=UPI000DCE41BD|nr:dioxygenase [Microbacterium sp. SMR1]RAZ34677.1 dioxygenase [Microbacterium sp. SMR1]
MAGRRKNRDDRAAHERARLYAARREYHDGLARRRSRDNVIAAIAGGVLILAAIGAQVAYFTAGPGAPAPAESPAPSPTETLSPTPTPTQTPTPADSTPTTIPSP